MAREEYDSWMTMAVVHKRCEGGLCRHCHYAIAPEAEIKDFDKHPWGACTGIQTLQVNPYAAEIEEDYREVMLCPGLASILEDDI
jgi:hypothetical protein